jgi:hypothetical protein
MGIYDGNILGNSMNLRTCGNLWELIYEDLWQKHGNLWTIVLVVLVSFVDLQNIANIYVYVYIYIHISIYIFIYLYLYLYYIHVYIYITYYKYNTPLRVQ